MRVLRIGPFRPLAAAYTLNELGDWLATIALAILVFDRTGDAFATTALFVSTKFLPSLLVPMLAARAERVSVSRTLCALYVAEACAFAALALTASQFSLVLICLLAFADGTLAATGRAVTRAATVAILEPRGRLREGNAVLNVGFASMNVAGPAAAGAVVATAGVATALWIAAVLFAGLGVMLGLARGLPSASTDETPWRARLRDGAAYVRRHPIVRPLICAQAGLLVLFTLVVPIEVIYAKESLGAGDAGYAALITAWGVGLVASSLLFVRIRDRPLPLLITVSTLAVGLGYAGMAVAPSIQVACAAAVLGGAGNGIQWVGVTTALQEAVHASMQARVAGFYEAVVTAMPGLGFVAGGALTALLSPRAAFAVSGGGVVLVVVVGALTWRRAAVGVASGPPRRGSADGAVMRMPDALPPARERSGSARV